MLDVTMILERLKLLATYVALLREEQQYSLEQFDGDLRLQFVTEHALQLSIQIVLDIATHILNATTSEYPKDYTDAVKKLGKRGVIPQSFATRISDMPKFRNIIVHHYADVDTKIVYRNMQENVDDFESFAKYIYEWLDKQGLLSDIE